MKRILTFIIAIAAMTACEKENTNEFSADILPGTRWEGTLTTASSGSSSSTSLTVSFRDASTGSITAKTASTQRVETHQMSYSVKGKTITFECPVINGIWTVTEYDSTRRTMILKDRSNTLMLQQK